MTHIGVDPGKTGAIGFLPGVPINACVLDLEDGMVPAFGLDPCVQYCVWVELPDGRPGKGLRDFIFSAGRIAGWFDARLGPSRVHTVSAALWIPAMGLSRGKGGAEASLAMARKLWPRLGPELTRVRDHNRAEALLLAEYGRRRGGL